MSSTTVSVIVPVHNGEAELARCLEALRKSTVAPLEVLVVDDGSTDRSREVAEALGARVLTTGRKGGPARARNAGARQASGDVLFFLDADVVAQTDAVGRVVAAFDSSPDVDAVIGSYDDDPAELDFLSQYKNLMHCFVHQTGQEQASTFWSGCGAIRREVFLAHSGFDESYARPAIEDIELGYRLFQAGRRMVLDKDLRVKHLKRWTFWNLLKTDILDRGIPWTELILRDRNMPNDLNLQLSQRISVALAFLCVGFALLMTIYWKGYFLTPLFALLLFVMGRFWLDAEGAPRGRKAFLGVSAGFAVLVGLAWSNHMLGIIPPVVLGYVLLFLRHRYAFEDERQSRVVSLFLLLYGSLSTLFIMAYLPGHAVMGVFFLILLGLVVLNNQFYLFLAAKRGRSFAMAAIPFHLLYHFYNGISFGAGLLRFTWRNLTGRGRAPVPEK
ncbi:MAG: glycosyltransferase family 2 protein [Bryobacterales bacterium]|nr:glycosyltransferase family 2 protein [Bryobacterales bacterium]